MPSHPFPAIIPAPSSLKPLPGRHSLLPSTRIIAAPKLLHVARQLQSALQAATGWAFELDTNTSVEQASQDPLLPSAICLAVNDQAAGPEAYRLVVGGTAIRIQASHPAGAFYAMQTLLQLLPPVVHQSVPRQDVDWSPACVEIEDAPRFRWRGAMLDSSRHFQPVAFIKKLIDLLALHKLNVFHWHLTDDQGWRIEIRKYPRLAEIGSRRSQSCRGHLDANAGGDGVAHEGFYTQTDIREIVAYAEERFVTIVPEIEMPGHAQAAIAAYPELGCTGKALEVSTTWGVHENIFNPNESTLRFLQDVLDEVIELFPGDFIHVGGDEATKTQWETSPTVQARIQELGLADETALQSYFISRMADHLARRGRRLIGWDEILEGGLARGAAVMSWRGIGGGIAAANAGHDVVMTPTQSTYFDTYQSLEIFGEPLAIGGHLPLDAAYGYDPIPAEVSPDNVAHILGIQGQLWTEYMPTPGHVEYMAFPRLSALAEVAWSKPEHRDFGSFKNRLAVLLQRLNIIGVRYRPPN